MTKQYDDEAKRQAVVDALNVIWDDFDGADADVFIKALIPLGYLVMKL